MNINLFEESKAKYTYPEDLAKDLNFDIILNYMVGPKKEDIRLIKEVLFSPITDMSVLKSRQAQMKLTCENKVLIDQLYTCISTTFKELKSEIDVIINTKNKNYNDSTFAAAYIAPLRTLANSFNVLLKFYDDNTYFCNNCFNSFFDNLFSVIDRETIINLYDFANELDAFKRKGDLTLLVKVGEGFKLADIEIISTREKQKKSSFLESINLNRKSVIKKNTEIYDDGVAVANHVILKFLEQTFNLLDEWKEVYYRLYRQIAFLSGCATLQERAKDRNCYFCYPDFEKEQCFEDLYELSLAFQSSKFPIPNTIQYDGKQFIIVTGANQGGKSTFLRSMGIALILSHCGMFVPAKSFSCRLYENIFSHFARREDAKMNTGRFEEELIRMENIMHAAGKTHGRSLLLLNESFASTTENTAAIVAMDISHAIESHDIDLFMVTHITKFANQLYDERTNIHLFLSAGREEANEEKYTMVEKKPDSTSFGLDLFNSIFPDSIDS